MTYTTSAGGVVINSKGQVLIVNQKGTSWSLPKGHVDCGEDFLATAKREIYEETGINNIIFVKKLGSYQREKIGDPTEMKTIHMFLFKTDEMKLKPQDPENPEAKWVEVEKVVDLLTAKEDGEFFGKIKLNFYGSK